MTEETTTPPEAETSATSAAQPSPVASTATTDTTSTADAAANTANAPANANAGEEDALRTRIAGLEGEVAALERQVASEREAASDYMHRWQQAQADFSNFRRRTRQEQEQAQRLLGLEATARILPALDSLERAFLTLPPTLRQLTWIDGIALIHMQLRQGLTSLGIETVGAEPGQPFDPQVHEAIGEVETAEHPEGHIAVVVQRGYSAGGTLLRPALVQVARAAPAMAGVAEPTDVGNASEGNVGEGVGETAAEAHPNAASTASDTHDTYDTPAHEHTGE